MPSFVQELFTSRGNYADGDTRIGRPGRIWYDSTTNTFRIQLDGTLGGTIIGGNASEITSVGTLTSGTIGEGFTAIDNARLANSSITFGSTSQSLGSTVSGLVGVTLDGGAIGGTTAAAGTFTTVVGRFNPRIASTATASSLTPDISAVDIYAYTALASALAINAPTGTSLDGNKLIFRLLDNGTARALTWNATYAVVGTTLPTTTVINKTTYVGCIYNANKTRWDVVAVTTEA